MRLKKRTLRMPKKNKGKSNKMPEVEAMMEQDGEQPSAEMEKCIALQEEYDELTHILNDLRRKVQELRCENDLLETEANQMRVDHKEYIEYVSKHIQKQDSAITMLSDSAQQELRDIHTQRDLLQEERSKQTNELKRQVLEKESELVLLKSEIEELGEIKVKQQQQLALICKLQTEVEDMGREHSESVQVLRAQFFSEKQRYEAEAQQMVHSQALAANKEASQNLISHTQVMSQENQGLRRELVQLTQRAQVLHEQQVGLQTHSRQLQLQLEYAQDLRKLRPAHTAQELVQQGAVCSERNARVRPKRPNALELARSLAALTQEEPET
ncbi:hypothetical protein AAFF_G00200760 [Aldrovandia affinis]|uniref:DUF4515 domain-containing protein n=1 Tax=Aldrovandia affinis TaxID=143900 RepID=A0AAD7RI21_9TELE|nr:hypothetical protein AAFF_G00200760 [Aldrovandia affinis]